VKNPEHVNTVTISFYEGTPRQCFVTLLIEPSNFYRLTAAELADRYFRPAILAAQNHAK
jgi:hypothetical protein